MENSDLEINETNFEQYFFDIKKNKPQPGQVLAKYTAVAELVEGNLKSDIIDILMNKQYPQAAVQMMRKLAMSSEADSIRVLIEMCQDLLNGMSVEEVSNKPYKFVIEFFFYTKKEYIPNNDPHWSVIELINKT